MLILYFLKCARQLLNVFSSYRYMQLCGKKFGIIRTCTFFQDMLFMLLRNKKIEEAKQVWADLRSEEVLFDQHTYGDIVRAFTDGGLPYLAMEFFDKMSSPDPPLSLPFRVILKGLIPYLDLREKVKEDFLELFPDMLVYDPPEDLLKE